MMKSIKNSGLSHQQLLGEVSGLIGRRVVPVAEAAAAAAATIAPIVPTKMQLGQALGPAWVAHVATSRNQTRDVGAAFGRRAEKCQSNDSDGRGDDCDDDDDNDDDNHDDNHDDEQTVMIMNTIIMVM